MVKQHSFVFRMLLCHCTWWNQRNRN